MLDNARWRLPDIATDADRQGCGRVNNSASELQSDSKFIIEFRRVGNAVKVSAIDPLTLTEVSIAGPLDAGETLLRRLAVRKLLCVLNRKTA